MSFVEPDTTSAKPGFGDFYIAGILASEGVFLAILAGSVIGFAWERSLPDALALLIVGGAYGAFLTGIFAVIFIAPAAAVMLLALSRLAPAGHWQGALTGMLIGLAVVRLLSGGAYPPMLWQPYAVFAVLGSLAGYIVQRWVIRWPRPPLADD